MKLRSRTVRDDSGERKTHHISFIGPMMLRWLASAMGHSQYPPERWREFAGSTPPSSQPLRTPTPPPKT